MTAVESNSLEQLYMEWKSSLFRFCLLFSGNEEDANEALVEAFVAFARTKSQQDGEPVELFKAAYRFLLPRGNVGDVHEVSFPKLLMSIPAAARATFILRSMRMSRVQIAGIVGVEVDDVGELLVSALLRLKELLPEEIFNTSRSES